METFSAIFKLCTTALHIKISQLFFRLKLRQNWSNLILGGLFGLSPNTVQENFVTSVIYINDRFHTIPRIWSAENTTQDEMGNQSSTESNKNS